MGEAGRRTAAEMDRFVASVQSEQASMEREQQRQLKEEYGITLGDGAGTEGEAAAVYYHNGSQARLCRAHPACPAPAPRHLTPPLCARRVTRRKISCGGCARRCATP